VRRQRAVARQRHCHLARERRRQASLLVDPGELAQLAVRVAEKLASSRRLSARSVSRCDLTDAYSPDGHRQRPGHQAGDPSGEIATPEAPDAATPSTRLEIDTMPSFAPSTAARSQLDR
jgi:hypothetical protein